MASILLKDTELHFPNFTIVSASAGSGKTHTLTLKILQLLLSPKVPNNRLGNVLAMTFTKNAAAEMRQRVLEYLKEAYHGKSSVLDQLRPLISLEDAQLQNRCGDLIETILKDYSSFQVQTIDSFMARVFRASALEFGFSPALETVLDNRVILDVAFEQFARKLTTDPSKQKLLEALTDLLVESQNTSSRYQWNPYHKISEEICTLYDTLNAQSREVVSPSVNAGQLTTLRQRILETFHRLHRLVQESGLEQQKNFEKAFAAANAGDVDRLITLKSVYTPVKGGKKDKDKVDEWNTRFAPILDEFRSLTAMYVIQQAYHYYQPYVEAYALFRETIESIMRRNGQVHLSDVYRSLLTYISKEIVPEVFYFLGDSIFHYLIDEFQDTAPIQWETMEPLLSEAVAKQGSLFIVGDTKQSIYGFRSADWRIMKRLMETTVFPSAPPDVQHLDLNYRSCGRIVDFGKNVFHEIVPRVTGDDVSAASGLSTFRQEVEEKKREKGYVEVVSFEDDGELEQSRAKILNIISNCRDRGYHCGDITILTPRNEHVIAVSEWLNSASLDFISHSSLDIRGRTSTNELIAFLYFLDSPIDDLAFTTVILSRIIRRVFAADGVPLSTEEIHAFLLNARIEDHGSPLYASFRQRFSEIWNRYFDELFTVVGYLPMYDLLSVIYKHFRLFDVLPEEEGALAKLLEVVKNFEETGRNNLKDFLAFAESKADETVWNIHVPQGTDAISVMTIHKAKGLANRVVIVLLVDSKSRPDNLFFEQTDEGVRLVHITQKNMEYSSVFQNLYHQRMVGRAVDDLNKLYVALTRAKEEMYIISVKSGYADEPSKFLPGSGFAPSKKPEVEPKDESVTSFVPLHFSTARVLLSSVAPERLALYERRRGDAVHDVLSRIEFFDADAERVIPTMLHTIAGSWMTPENEKSMISALVEFLRLPEVAPFFASAEGRTIMNEQEYVHPDGRLFRMDRVVVDPVKVTVLDFKTGDDKEEYTEQVQGYMTILQNYYNGRIIQGVLAFVDGKKIRGVT